MQPLVSIVSTLYNYRDYVIDMIHSVQKQVYENWELIIVDDASTDTPLETISPYLVDSRIQYLPLPENHGYSYAKNVGIRASRGEYIVMIDADDLLYDKYSITYRLEALLKHPEKLWCHGDSVNLEPSGNICTTSNARMKRRERRKRMTAEGTLETEYSHRLIHSQTIMVRREFHKRLGLYDENLWCSSDNEMFRRALRFGIIPYYIADIVSLYRIHPDQMHRSPEKRKIIVELKKQIIADVEKRFQEGINANNTSLLEESDE